MVVVTIATLAVIACASGCAGEMSDLGDDDASPDGHHYYFNIPDSNVDAAADDAEATSAPDAAPMCISSRGPCTPGGTSCCTGQTCGTTTLGQVCCGNAGAPCVTANGEDCCGALECVSGHCVDPASTCLHSTQHCSGGGCCSGLTCGTTSLGQVCCGNAGAPCATADGSDCCGALLCIAGHCGTSGSGPCGYLQWWNSAITYQWMSGLGWDTDLSVHDGTPVVLRHASTLESAVINPLNAGYMPQFMDNVTGHRFRFFHLHPQSAQATNVGHVYPAGFVVGYSGGGTSDTGYPRLSSGPHLCVQTVVTYRTAFPSGVDACY
jgi:hypothetical protein